MKNNQKQKYIATLVGCGIGDTLGMPIETWTKEKIENKFGRLTEFIDSQCQLTRDLKAGEYTDDTILTLAIAESIAKQGKLDLEDISKKQIEAYNQCIQTNGHVKGGFGRTTKNGFENMKKGISPLESGVLPGLGNGPAMKMSPVGLYMDATKNCKEGLEMARLIGRSTHLDPRAVASGVVQAYATYLLLNDSSRQEFLDSLVRVCEKYEAPMNPEIPLREAGDLSSKLRWIRENKDVNCNTAFEQLGNSCLAFESYPFTIFMFQKYFDKPIEGLIETVNFGGDCDTTGAIYGTLAGAKHGMIFPEKWTTNLQNRNRLTETAEKIYNLGEKNETYK